jgi:hypothetical protein
MLIETWFGNILNCSYNILSQYRVQKYCVKRGSKEEIRVKKEKELDSWSSSGFIYRFFQASVL